MAWDELLGQPQAVSLLTQALIKDRIAGGYLFQGPEGVGKSLAVKLFVQGLLQDEHPQPLDLLWLEPTKKGEEQALGQVRLEQIRTGSRFLSRHPLKAQRSVLVIEGAETMAEPAANCLLKTLEEPGHGVVILITHQAHLLLPTLRSRCQNIPFYRLAPDLLQSILGADYPAALLPLAQGSPGLALKNLEQFSQISTALLDAFFPWPQQPLPLLTLAREVDSQLSLLQQLWLVDYLQERLWAGGSSKAALTALEQLRHQLTHHVQPRLAWEVALLETR